MRGTFLSRFTPSIMKPEALEALFVQREELASRLVDLISESALTPSKHHSLLIGPRGIGKTHLISLVYHRVHAIEELRGRLVIAWLREEEWGVASFLDLLLRIFRTLADEHAGLVPPERVEAFYELSPDEAERAGAALLKEIIGDRALLILTENMDDLFEGLGDKGQKRLRSYLQENPFCTILATAQSLFNGVSLQTSPFYGFFHIYHLKELTFDDASRLLIKIAEFSGDHELASLISTPKGRARIRTVRHLAGGNHRVYVIFSQFLTCDALDDLVEPFMRMLDDLTPYYQARMTWLSSQQQKIIEFLCDRRSAVPVKEIAQRCFVTHQTASSQLGILYEKGYLRSTPVGRESYYELREPLMRLCIEVKKNRGEPVRLFIDFLRLWYSRIELQERLQQLQPRAVLEREYLNHALLVTEEYEDPRVTACLEDHSVYVEKGDFTSALKAAEDLVTIRGQADDWAEHGHCLAHLRRWDNALASFDKAIALDRTDARTWRFRGWALGTLGRDEDALTSFDKAIELDPKSGQVWDSRGIALRRLGRFEEAIISFDKMIELEPNYASPWFARGDAFSHLGKHEEALVSFNKVIELDPKDMHALFHKGLELVDLGRYEEALTSFDKTIEREPKNFPAWGNQGLALFNLNRFSEALRSFDKMIELESEDARSWAYRGLTLRNLSRYEEALAAFDKAIELNVESGIAPDWRNKGEILSMLDRYEEALAAFDKAIELEPTSAAIWHDRSIALGNIGRYGEALRACDKTVELGGESWPIFFNRAEALLALDIWDEGISVLNHALQHAVDSDSQNRGDTAAIIRNLFTRIHNPLRWDECVRTLIDLYKKYQALAELGQGLVQSLSELNLLKLGEEGRRTWLNAWQESGSHFTELQLPIRLLDVGVRYCQSYDERILLELPIEERKLLESLGDGRKIQADSDFILPPSPRRRGKNQTRRGRGKRELSSTEE